MSSGRGQRIRRVRKDRRCEADDETGRNENTQHEDTLRRNEFHERLEDARGSDSEGLEELKVDRWGSSDRDYESASQ